MSDEAIEPLTFYKEHVKHSKCCCCMNGFLEIGNGALSQFNLPVLLKCKHHACDDCIAKSRSTSNGILCRLCKVTASDVLDEKMVHRPAYLMGHMLFVNDAIATKEAGGSEDQGSEETGSNDQITHHCIECEIAAEVTCIQCENKFCSKCWEEVHNGRASLKHHKKAPIIDDEMELEKGIMSCKEHIGTKMDSYCQDCELVLCSRCIKFHHQNHISCSLAEQNKEARQNLVTVITESTAVLEKMKESLTTLQEVNDADCENEEISAELQKVVEWYNQLHGFLQVQEMGILHRMTDCSNREVQQRKEYQRQLKTDIDKMTACLLKAETAKDMTDDDCPDLPSILKSLKDLSKKPCQIVKKSNNKRKNSKFATFKKNVFDEMSDLVLLNEPPESGIILRPFKRIKSIENNTLLNALKNSNCPPAVEKGKGREIQRTVTERASNKKNEIDEESVKSDSSTRSLRSHVSVSCTAYSAFEEGYSCYVSVVYLRNPDRICVNLKTEQSRLDSLQLKIKYSAGTAGPLKYLTEGMLVIAPFRNEYYRARILEVHDDDNLSVEFIDYGNQVTLKKSSVKNLLKEYNRDKPFALRCCLHDCEPIGKRWPAEATKVIEDVLKSSRNTAQMFVKKVHVDRLEVDLHCDYSDYSGRELIDLKTLLILRKYARRTGIGPSQTTTNSVYYKEQKPLVAGSLIKMKIATLFSPSNFYAYQSNDGPRFADFNSKMSSFCHLHSSSGIIHAPYIGMPVAFLEKEFWFRGKITKLLSGTRVEVVKVDNGGAVELNVNEIRRLLPNFLKLQPMAYRLTLANVESSGDKWSTEAVNTLKRYILNQTVTVEVSVVEPTVASVFIFKNSSNKSICVNKVLVDEGLAKSTAIMPTMPKIIATGGRGSHQRQTNRPKLDEADKVAQLLAPRSDTQIISQVIKSEEEEEKESDEDGKELVRVVKVQSPACIYIADSKSADELACFEADLKEMYLGSLPEVVKRWQNGNPCVFYDRANFKWQRGRVLEVLEENLVKIRAIDEMLDYEVSMDNIREASDEVMKKKFLVNCYLSGIVPPGPSWSSLAAEVLEEEILAAENIYIKKEETYSPKTDSIPIELLASKTISDGPLTPLYVDTKSLNRTLVDKGLALPKITTKKAVSPKKETTVVTPVKSDDCIAVPVNIVVPSVNQDWLLQSPILFNARIIGEIQNVDERGVIYFTDKNDESMLQRIRDELGGAFSGSRPSSNDYFWEVGQMCSARFHIDNSWNRGKILKKDPENREYLVLFVDYGNIEKCRVQDLRKGVCMPDVPMLARQCYIGDLRPVIGNTYTGKAIDLLHRILVGNVWLIDITELTEEPFPVRLTSTNTYVDISQIMVERGHGQRLPNPCVVTDLPPRLIASGDEAEIGLAKHKPNIDLSVELPKWHGNILQIPEDLEYIPVKIVLITEDGLYAHVVPREVPNELCEQIEEFDALEEELLTVGPSLPDLQNVVEGAVCVAMFEDAYYRAVIESINPEDPDCVIVYFVDYGNKGSTRVNCLYQCKQEWMRLPGMCRKMKLSGVVPTDKSWSIQLDELVNSVEVIARIINRRGNVYEVELKTGVNGDLIYQPLIDEGVLMLMDGDEVEDDDGHLTDEGILMLRNGHDDDDETGISEHSD